MSKRIFKLNQKPIVVTEGGMRLYTVMSEGSPLKGWTFQADSVQEVGEWMNENREWYRKNNWLLKTPCWESEPISTAKLVWCKNVYEDGCPQEQYRECNMSFWVEDLTPPKVYRQWEDLTVDEKLEAIKDILYEKAVVTRDYKIQKEI